MNDLPVKRARRRTMSWSRQGRTVSSRVPMEHPLHTVRYGHEKLVRSSIVEELLIENIKRSIVSALGTYPVDTTTHGMGVWVIDGVTYRRTHIPANELAKGTAIVIHTHGARYPHSWEDVDQLRRYILNREGIAQVVLSPEINHYFVLSPSVDPANRMRLIDFLKMKPSQIKNQLFPKGMSSREKETTKLKNFAERYGLEFREGHYS